MNIPFNKPYSTGKEIDFIKQSIESGHISGDGMFTKLCHDYFKNKYGFKSVLLTTSCTDALELISLLIDIVPGDEVIVPTFTFVSTVNAFVLRGAKIVFVDSQSDNPNLDVDSIESLITPKTKAIVCVHYAGFACEMAKLVDLSNKYNLFLIEDAAQSIDNYFISKDGSRKPLGSFGHFSAFSFHETKNIIAGEGGLLVINDERYVERAEIIREKGTNRSQFFRGEINKYGWVDVGSSFLPTDIVSAFLYAQLLHLDEIQKKRLYNWNLYKHLLSSFAEDLYFKLPFVPSYSSNNGHMFFLICRSLEERTKLISYLKSKGIMAVFHYLSLHKSEFMVNNDFENTLQTHPNSDFFTDTLVRLPLFYELTEEQIKFICSEIILFYQTNY
jgi:dTDP-4-amino-4,6-dideoxygalactose transaminase